MSIKSLLLRLAIRNGSIAGALALTMIIVLYVADKHPFLVPMIADFRIFLFGLFIFFTLKEYRDKTEGNILYFWQGMVGAYQFIGVFSLVTAIGIMIFSSIEPNFIQEYITLFLQQAEAGKAEVIQQMGKENFERNLEAIRATNGPERAFVYVIQNVWIGLFISIIISVILRKQPKQ
ncbi:MAG: DUF4199 domain-containing protein [Cyclobacteriaceae bacterium]|jgi:hypothetical protein|nr:DUF4199 domain-containing protein [Cytophagales bacterium]MCZ8328889.1 DUF4199 domain-containing protein [Cyclobacteriaceae bacterium]